MKCLLIGNGFDNENNIYILFEEFIIWLSKNKKVEFKSHFKYFELDDQNNNEYWNRYSLVMNISPEKKWSDFEGYLWFIIDEFKLNNSIVKKVNLYFEEWFEFIYEKKQKEFKKSNYLKSFFEKNKISTVLSLNYTDTLKHYGFEEAFLSKENNQSQNLNKLNNKYLNLHYVSHSPKYIIGNDCKSISNKSLLLKTNGYPDRFKNRIFNQLVSLKSELHIYGYSFGNSDAVLNERIRFFLINGNQSLYIYLFAKNSKEFKEKTNELLNGVFKNISSQKIIFIDILKEKKKMKLNIS